MCLSHYEGDLMIFEAPQNLSLGVGITTNLTCRGNGPIVWVFDGLQIRDENPALEKKGIVAETGRMNSAALVITGSGGGDDTNNNGTVFFCRVERNVFDAVESEPAHLLIYGKSS